MRYKQAGSQGEQKLHNLLRDPLRQCHDGSGGRRSAAVPSPEHRRGPHEEKWDV